MDVRKLTKLDMTCYRAFLFVMDFMLTYCSEKQNMYLGEKLSTITSVMLKYRRGLATNKNRKT